jgi:hypothetical protein
MALPNYSGSNPGSVTPGLSGTLAPSKPGYPAPSKPMPIVGGQNPGLQQEAQSNLPYTPNNGNPNGANNSGAVNNSGPVGGRRMSRFNTRFGGGQIGGTPQEGAVLGANGIYYGSGAVTPGQQQFNDEQIQREQQSLMNSGNVLQQMMALLNSGRRSQQPGMVPRPNQPISMPSLPGLGGGVPNMGHPVPGMGNNSGGGLPVGGGYPQGPQSPYPNQPIGAPTLNQQGMNTNTYYGGQNPELGRYRPPQMIPGGGWADNGGYRYNLPNAYGPYPNYQTGPYGYGNNYG